MLNHTNGFLRNRQSLFVNILFYDHCDEHRIKFINKTRMNPTVIIIGGGGLAGGDKNHLTTMIKVNCIIL